MFAKRENDAKYTKKSEIFQHHQIDITALKPSRDQWFSQNLTRNWHLYKNYYQEVHGNRMVQHSSLPSWKMKKRGTLLCLLTSSMDAHYLHDFCFHCLPLTSTLPVFSYFTYISFNIGPATWNLSIQLFLILSSHILHHPKLIIVPHWLHCPCLPFPDSCIFHNYITHVTLSHPRVNDMINFANSFTWGISSGGLLKHPLIWPLWHSFFSSNLASCWSWQYHPSKTN